MKKSKFTEAQIVFANKQSEQGVRVDEICPKMVFPRPLFTTGRKNNIKNVLILQFRLLRNMGGPQEE